MSRKRSNKPPRVVVPISVPEDMKVRIRSLSDKVRLSDADVMRMAIDRGLGLVEKMFEPQTSKAA
jgi:hypothetical protein